MTRCHTGRRCSAGPDKLAPLPGSTRAATLTHAEAATGRQGSVHAGPRATRAPRPRDIAHARERNRVWPEVLGLEDRTADRELQGLQARDAQGLPLEAARATPTVSSVEFMLLGLAVFASSAAIDFAAARWTRAVSDLSIVRSGMWTVVQWTASSLGLLLAVRISWWLLPFEGMGLAAGSMLEVWRTRERRGGVSLS